MSSKRITPRLEQELATIAEQQGCELVHAEFRGGVLQIVLDRPDGLSLAHCESYSKQASALLDVEDFGADRYLLEVSSPGLDRQLYRASDWQRFLGHEVRVTFHEREGDERRKRTVVGRLEDFDPANDGIAMVIEPAGESHRIPLPAVKVARLVPQL